MGDQNWQGGPVLAAKIGPGGPILAADRFWRRTDFFVTGQTSGPGDLFILISSSFLMIQYLYLSHVFRLVANIHRCKTAFCAFWLCFSALSRVGKRYVCFPKSSFRQ